MRKALLGLSAVLALLIGLVMAPAAQAGTATVTVPCGSSTPDFHGTYNHTHYSGGTGVVSSVSWTTSYPQGVGSSYHTLDVIVNHNLYKRVTAWTTGNSGTITISSGTHTQITMRWKINASLDNQVCGPVDTIVIT
jgi:hypothetical protein